MEKRKRVHRNTGARAARRAEYAVQAIAAPAPIDSNASEWVNSMKSAHGKAAATMVEVMPMLIGLAGGSAVYTLFERALENKRCCDREDGPVVYGTFSTPQEMETLVHQLGHQLFNGVRGLIAADVPQSTIRQIFNDSFNAEQATGPESVTLPEGMDPQDPATMKMLDAHFDLMDGEQA